MKCGGGFENWRRRDERRRRKYVRILVGAACGPPRAGGRACDLGAALLAQGRRSRLAALPPAQTPQGDRRRVLLGWLTDRPMTDLRVWCAAWFAST